MANSSPEPREPSAQAHSGVPQRLAAAWPPARWRDVHVLVAASGGADSMALLRALAELKRQAGGPGILLAAHVNHGLRGAAGDDDERWLQDECRTLGVPLEVRRTDAAALAATAGDGLEAAARAARYRLLAEMAETAGARFVATAHTRDDQVETVLFQLLRGAGLRGLAGMRSTRELAPSVALVRPLLGATRDELVAYLQSLRQAWREDHTNRDLRFARNRVRQELLPYVREHFNADADAAIARTAALAGEVQTLLEQLADQLLARTAPAYPPGAAALTAPPLSGQPELVVREALRLAWRRAGFAEQAMTDHWWRQLAQLALSSKTSGALNLPGNVLARREGDRLVLAPPHLP
jgi:tRNA(Ile)-lysidine synthase